MAPLQKNMMAMAAVGMVVVISTSYHMLHIAEHHTDAVGTDGAAEKDTMVSLIRSLQREHREMTEMLKQSLDRIVRPVAGQLALHPVPRPICVSFIPSTFPRQEKR